MATGDWQELGQSVFIGLIFAFLVAKLISTVVSFREDKLKLVRSGGDELLPSRPPDAGSGTAEPSPRDGSSAPPEVEHRAGLSDREGGSEDDDDWEGIEGTELDEAFSAAAAFIAVSAADRMSPKVSSDTQLQLYALYKIVTEGPCTASQPSAIKVTARAKWNAWQKLGVMPPEEAMHRYITIVNELFPSWASNTGSTSKNDQGIAASASTSSAGGTMGPVFSSFLMEEETEVDIKLDEIHVFAKEGETKDMCDCIDNGVSVNQRDSEGRTPLHWAVDRGHFDAVEMLINRGADVNAKDDECQMPLHYAVVCERESIAELLVKHKADRHAKDGDGNSPQGLCRASWAPMLLLDGTIARLPLRLLTQCAVEFMCRERRRSSSMAFFVFLLVS